MNAATSTGGKWIILLDKLVLSIKAKIGYLVWMPKI
jgi:hypothetical protein